MIKIARTPVKVVKRIWVYTMNRTPWWRQPPSEGASTAEVLENVSLVRRVHLLEEDEGENGVGSEARVVRREALPQTEEAFLANHRRQHVLSTGR